MLSTKLHLNRTYKSHWFASLLALLFVAVAFNTVKPGWRLALSIPKLGFTTVHVGILILLAGGGVSKACTDRGILHLYVGDPPADEYWGHYDSRKLRRMPFALSLEKFKRQDWKALEVHFDDQRFASRVPRYTLWEGARDRARTTTRTTRA